MGKRQILDCTVRDGGYINDWKFGSCVLTETIQRLINAGVDYVELGFIDERRYYDEDRSIFPNALSINDTYKHLKRKDNTKLVAMIDYGTCDIKNICKKDDSILDGIRVIFKKEKMEKALEYCSEIKKLGYEVFTQLVSTTAYTDDDFNKLIELENELMPYAVSIVDTYGLMDSIEMDKIYDKLDQGLNKNITLAFHAHNNLLSAFSNSSQFLSMKTDRNLLVDGTIMGMGKGAGNSPIELLANYCNKMFGSDYNMNELLEAAESNIMKLFGRSNWGYSIKFLLASINRVHPNYVSDYITKNVLSISNLNNLLKGINEEDKLLYNKDESERNYNNYCMSHFNDESDISKLKSIIEKKTILLLGPGKSIEASKDKISLFIGNENPIVIALNYLPKIKTDFIFITNSRRHGYLANSFDEIYSRKVKIIATNNITSYFRDFDFHIDYSDVIDQDSFARDSAIIMVLKLLELCSANRVYLAGLDGYASSFEDDFVNLSNSYGWKEPYVGFLNSYIRNQIKKFSVNMDILFLTSSLFEGDD